MAKASPEERREGSPQVTDDDHLPHVAVVGEALDDWPPCWALVDEGQCRQAWYVAVLLDPIPGEYYPFVGAYERLAETGVNAEILGLEEDPETGSTALLLRVVGW